MSLKGDKSESLMAKTSVKEFYLSNEPKTGLDELTHTGIKITDAIPTSAHILDEIRCEVTIRKPFRKSATY